MLAYLFPDITVLKSTFCILQNLRNLKGISVNNRCLIFKVHHSCGGSEEPFLKKALLLYQTHLLLSTPFLNFFSFFSPFSPTSPGVASFPFRFLFPYLVDGSFCEILYIVSTAAYVGFQCFHILFLSPPIFLRKSPTLATWGGREGR